MPRIIDPALLACLDRENPRAYLHPEILAPDAERVLRRASDQFLLGTGSGGPRVSAAPSSSVFAASAGGALQLAPVDDHVAHFSTFSGIAALPRESLQRRRKTVGWRVDPSFHGVLRGFRVYISQVAALYVPTRWELQIFRATGVPVVRRDNTGRIIERRTEWTFTELLTPAPIRQTTDIVWATAINGHLDFGLEQYGLSIEGRPVVKGGSSSVEEPEVYYFQLRPLDDGTSYNWRLDSTTSRSVAGVGSFARRWWAREADTDPWVETVHGDTYGCRVTVESYPVGGGSAVYQIDLGRPPVAEAEGRIIFERALPRGTGATLELSTAGSGGPWTAVTHQAGISVAQQLYHLRLTLTPDAAVRATPLITAFGVQWRTRYPVEAESVIDPLSIEASAPFLESAIGDGRLTVFRMGRRDFEDVASSLASTKAPSQLEVETYLASDHPSAPRATWLLLDRAQVADRAPSELGETFTLYSLAARLKRKVPRLVETINSVHTIASVDAGGASLTVAIGQPLLGTSGAGNEYDGKGYYFRVRKAANASAIGFSGTISGNTGTTQLDFAPAIANLAVLLAPGDEIEVHSGIRNVQTRTWTNADPADVWWELLTVDLGIPPERIGLAGLGRAGRSGLPPTVTDICPGDATGQARRRVTMQLTAQEEADALIDQVSFLMGGMTTVIAGQFVFRQIYALRNAAGAVTVPPEPVAAVFDPRDYVNPTFPAGLESRAPVVSCTYGVNRAAANPDAYATQTTNWTDADAVAHLSEQDLDLRGTAEIPEEIARWCYNSSDAGLTLASESGRQVCLATSTGLRVWPIVLREAQYALVPGDSIVLITDRLTDYDPATRTPLKGWLAVRAIVLGVAGDRRTVTVFVPGLTDNVTAFGGVPGERDEPGSPLLNAPAISATYAIENDTGMPKPVLLVSFTTPDTDEFTGLDLLITPDGGTAARVRGGRLGPIRIPANWSTTYVITPSAVNRDGVMGPEGVAASCIIPEGDLIPRRTPFHDDVGVFSGYALYSVTSDGLQAATGVTQSDGVAQRVLAKGYIAGTAVHNVPVVFAQNFQNAPMVILTGGVTHQPAAKWGTLAQVNAGTAASAYQTTKPTYDETQALNKTAAGFTPRLVLRQKDSSVTARTHSFSNTAPSTTSPADPGDYGEATLANAPANTDTYTAAFDIQISVSAVLGMTLTKTVVLAFDTDTGTGWVERDTRTYTHSHTHGSGLPTSNTWAGELVPVVVSGASGTSKLRVRVKSVTLSGTGLDSHTVTLDEVTYNTSASADLYASRTPDAGDVARWEALAVN